MILPLLLLLTCTNVVHVIKTEDVLICTNDTDCSESTISTTYTQSPDDSASHNSSSSTEEETLFLTTLPTEITSSRTNSDVTEPKIESTSTASPPVVVIPSNKTLKFEEKELCECDLTKFACDINCCCDRDCNQSHLSAFSRCQDYHVELYDSRYCYNRNFIQRNNTPFILEKLGNNLFCIVYDNIPSTYSASNDLNEKDLWNAIQAKTYKWKIKSDELQFISPKYNLSKYYQHGDTLWKLHDKSIEATEFPQSGFTGICSLKKTLRYLEDWRDTCIQSELTNVNRYLFSTTFNNFTIIKSLPLFNDTFVTKQVCRSDICLPIRTHYCSESFSVCNRTGTPGFCVNSTCTNIVKSVKYVIVHNGSVGVDSVDAYFGIGDASRAFYQRHEVRYEWIDTNRTRAFARSGNPGYIAGKPIVVGAPRTNASNAEIFFNRTAGFLTLPVAARSGECDRIDRHIVAFGEDVRLRCVAKIATNNFTALSCAELQNLTMDLLTSAFALNASRPYNLYVSKLGNFTNRNAAEWSRVVFDRTPQSVVTARTVGRRILCSGLITTVHLNVLYSTLPKPKTLMNYKILGVGVTFGKEEDISWPKCTLKACTDVLHVDILSYVNFHDVTKPFKYYFVGSNLDITLPYDFFYPFLSGSERTKRPNILILFIIHIYVLYTM